ncbi:50S ribosomal protein L25 [Candidatus Poriferisodalis sp.]|uniref:50S ribosomal protein L25 n=1 Tax=Candidatus Poriferisodalis sp. TaxID=3101277 RepID=UPI003B01893D
MEQMKLVAHKRTATGSGPSRRLRADDKIPAVMYGHGTDPVLLTLDRLRFRAALNAAGPNAIITLEVGGKNHLTIVKDMQRDSIANRVTHVDFMLVSLDERLEVDVPVRLVGEPVAASRQGAVLQQQLMSLHVESSAGAIPPSLDVDVSELSLENPVRVSDMALPGGMVSLLDGDTLVVIAQRTRAAVAAEQLGEDGEALEKAGQADVENADSQS